MARPGLYTAERLAKIVAYIGDGNTRRAAANLSGVSETTLHEWLSLGRRGDPRYVDFASAVEHADALAEAEMVSRVRAAADRSWQAAAWWLERRRQADYAIKRDAPAEEPSEEQAVEREADRVAVLEELLIDAKRMRGDDE